MGIQAITDFSAIRPGELNQSGGDMTELFRDMLLFELLSIYHKKLVTKGMFTEKNIAYGESATFDAMGEADAELLASGYEMTGSAVNFAKKNILIDGLRVSHGIIHDVEQFILHYDVRQPLITKLARALARQKDYINFLSILKGSEASHVLDDSEAGSGTKIESDKLILNPSGGGAATMNELGASVYEAIGLAYDAMNKQNVPGEDRYVALPSEQYRSLLQYAKNEVVSVIDKDIDGSGSISKGVINMLLGFRIIQSNNIPHTDVSDTSKWLNHTYDASKTVGIAWQKECIANLVRKGLGFEVGRHILSQSDIIVAREMYGSDWINPSGCVQFAGSTLSYS